MYHILIPDHGQPQNVLETDMNNPAEVRWFKKLTEEFTPSIDELVDNNVHVLHALDDRLIVCSEDPISLALQVHYLVTGEY